jgi:hypothetical protein
MGGRAVAEIWVNYFPPVPADPPVAAAAPLYLPGPIFQRFGSRAIGVRYNAFQQK